MKLAAIFLLLAGWGIVLSAIVLFPHEMPRGGFVLAGMCLEALGLAIAFRGHSDSGREAE